MAQSGSKGRILGEFQHSLDEKGRVAIPAKYRGSFSDGAVVTRGVELCLVLYPLPEWDEFAAKIGSLPASQADARQIARAIFSVAADVELDRLGRINIPSQLRRYAGLGGDVTLAGIGTQFEIWDRNRWEHGRDTRDDIANQLERFGI
ncbi:MAG TPA: division/cell wall cluster transcriptional repressor MraZ [Chloroflexota bacterium]|nr:division/cell wall cluster transcriptional repressor MraZ [Chloroflexota bacterium]